MNKKSLLTAIITTLSLCVTANLLHAGEEDLVPDEVIEQQRENLKTNTEGKGFGPQSPRDIDSAAGKNPVIFSAAPHYTKMNLCNIHFHKNAEHKGGDFTTYAGNGDGHGYNTGYKYSGKLSRRELAPINGEICPSDHGGLHPGDTIEVHYVHSSAQVEPGPTLGACLSDSIMNPQLRVEAQVFVVVNDPRARDFGVLTAHGKKSEQWYGRRYSWWHGNEDDFYQAHNIPFYTGWPVQYSGSTTGPSYNEQGSPFQVTWSVRPRVAKVNIATVGEWCLGNDFFEDHAHGVRNLVINPDLLSNLYK